MKDLLILSVWERGNVNTFELENLSEVLSWHRVAQGWLSLLWLLQVLENRISFWCHTAQWGMEAGIPSLSAM